MALFVEPLPGDQFTVEGGLPIQGALRPAGNKNEALPVIAASLLVSGPIVLDNLPQIGDVETLLETVRGLGADIARVGERSVRIDASGLASVTPDPALASRIRGSFLLAAPLLARQGAAVLPRPGGDQIGRRRVDTHVLALRQLGAEIELRDDVYRLTLPGRFKGAEVFLDEASVTATENAVMAAVLARGKTRLLNAACEPHVQGLCHALTAMGAKIQGIGTNALEIEGVDALEPATHRIGPDHIEIGSFVALAAMTGGELRVLDVVPADLRMIRLVFARLGLETQIEGTTLVVPGGQRLAVSDDLGGAIPTVDDAPWPGFPADLTPTALVLATQCAGTVLIHEKLFESRLFFVDRLIDMGARVVLCDPHRAVVAGPSRLHGATLVSPDIRAGMALLGAALCARGTSCIRNARQIDRGYERIDERLRELGARITRG